MFEPESIQPYELRHIQRNRISIPQIEIIKSYSFFVDHKHGRSKYIVHLHCFKDQMIVSFYKKDRYVKKERYRVVLNENTFGRVGITVLKIVVDNIVNEGYNGFGLIGASKPNEKTERLTHRYKIYTEIIRRKVGTDNFDIIANDNSSTIFVLSKTNDQTKTSRIKTYNGIFKQLY